VSECIFAVPAGSPEYEREKDTDHGGVVHMVAKVWAYAPVDLLERKLIDNAMPQYSNDDQYGERDKDAPKKFFHIGALPHHNSGEHGKRNKVPQLGKENFKGKNRHARIEGAHEYPEKMQQQEHDKRIAEEAFWQNIFSGKDKRKGDDHQSGHERLGRKVSPQTVGEIVFYRTWQHGHQ